MGKREREQLDDRRRPSHPTDKRRASHCTWDPAAPRTQLCRLAAHLRRSHPETRSSLSRPEVASLSLLEAASLSLEEAFSFCLLSRAGACSLFEFVSLLENRERGSCLSLSFSWTEREFSLWEREREQLDDKRRHSHPTPRA